MRVSFAFQGRAIADYEFQIALRWRAGLSRLMPHQLAARRGHDIGTCSGLQMGETEPRAPRIPSAARAAALIAFKSIGAVGLYTMMLALLIRHSLIGGDGRVGDDDDVEASAVI